MQQPFAFNNSLFAANASSQIALMEQEMRHNGIPAHLGNRLMTQKFFHDMARTDLLNASNDKRLDKVRAITLEAAGQRMLEGDNAIALKRYVLPVAHNRAWGASLTPELRHPTSGKESSLLVFNFIPRDPSALHIRNGTDLSKRLATQTIAVGPQPYWGVNNSKWRYSGQ